MSHCRLSQCRRLRVLAILLTLLTSTAAQAAFITDKVVVEVHAQRFNQGAVLKTLSSGSSVEIILSDGKFSRIRTTDNITGWVESKYLSNEKPVQLEYLELLAKSKGLEARLKTAEEQLAQAKSAPSSGISEEEMAELQKRAKNVGWMRVELTKARKRAEELENQIKAQKEKKAGANTQLTELEAKNEELKTANAELEQRLAAALLVNQQQEANAMPVNDASPALESAPSTAQAHEHGTWSVAIEWFFGSIVVALMAGAIAGMLWLDKRIRQRHGGFRIY
jgi:hypothetical protein